MTRGGGLLRVRVASGWVGFCGVCALAMGWVAGICGAAEAGDAAPTPVPGVRAMRRAAITLADLKAQIPQSAAGQFVMELPQILHTAMDPEVLALMDGQVVETTGMMLGGVVTEVAGNAGNGGAVWGCGCASGVHSFSAVRTMRSSASSLWSSIGRSLCLRRKRGCGFPGDWATNATAGGWWRCSVQASGRRSLCPWFRCSSERRGSRGDGMREGLST